MARVGRKDRGLLSKPDATGKLCWYARLYHEGKEQRFGAFKNKTEARAFYEKAKGEQRTGHYFPEQYRRGGKEAAGAVIASYLGTLPTSGKTSTTIVDERHYGQWWTARLEGKALHAVSPAILEQAMAELAEKHYAPQTIVHYLKFLRHVFRWAIGRGVIENTPFVSVTLPTVRAGKTRFLSMEEEARLCATIGQPYAAWIRLAILTGLRKSEQFGLRWADIDLERGLMTLPHTKSGHVQYVHLVEEAKAILSSLIPGNTSVWVFPGESPNTHLNPKNFYAGTYMTALKDAKLEGVTWHTLRHTFASRLAMNGQNPSTIASLLRHSGTALVSRYAHLSPSHLQGALEGVAGFGKGKVEPVQTVPEPRQEGDNLILTVLPTGTEQDEQEEERVHVVDSMGQCARS